MGGLKLNELKESELASKDKYWKSIVNKDLKLAIGKNTARIRIECRF